MADKLNDTSKLYSDSKCKKSNYSSLDIAKFVFAILLVCAHTASEVVTLNRSIDTVLSLYIVAVPFFFTCSAFLFFSKLKTVGQQGEQWSLFKKYFRRVGVMYLLWSAIYFPFILAVWLPDRVTFQAVAHYCHKFVVYTSYATIWFLPALLVGITMVYVLRKWFSIERILLIGALFYVIGAIGYSYAGIMVKLPLVPSFYHAWETVFFTTRNGVFNGFPFVALGAYIAYSEKKPNQTVAFSFSILFGCLFIAEAFALKLTVGFPVGGADTVLFLFPFTYFFFHWLLTIRLQERSIYLWMRQLSLLIFLSQRLFLSAIPSLLPPWFVEEIGRNAAIGMLTIVGSTIAFSFLLIGIGKKVDVVKKLW